MQTCSRHWLSLRPEIRNRSSAFVVRPRSFFVVVLSNFQCQFHQRLQMLKTSNFQGRPHKHTNITIEHAQVCGRRGPGLQLRALSRRALPIRPLLVQFSAMSPAFAKMEALGVHFRSMWGSNRHTRRRIPSKGATSDLETPTRCRLNVD